MCCFTVVSEYFSGDGISGNDISATAVNNGDTFFIFCCSSE
ncbi:hypothetical protein XBKB1_1060010 [Xenorhabdus bovienii str. kraussei Becker Underwood]|uniref:Uncharacterized protein n=1 Tax=Xenorhabdus bovienii str. kraussei Becker Underwood TaxID=1398204 RepID=A0A077PMK1_XENBV|nr:hypothetical protein XBKB1_1060010 [Xenorhabdus bovienii str. kraussei Becker Underwood]